jgi:hypothetical protein
MPEIIQSREGYATVEYKIVLTDKRVISFDPTRVTFVDAEITDSVYSHATALHTFRTLEPLFLDSIKVAMSTADPLFEFRLGFGTPQQTFWLPWQRHIITKYSARFEGIANAAGHFLVFETADSLIRFERANKVIARKGTVAEIVKTIAEENDLESVVEPTDGKFLLYQSFWDDTRFIRQRCLPRAINKSGRGGYYFFIRDNVIHFHTPDYQSNARQMNYYDVFGTELTLSDVSQDPALWDSGVAGLRVIGHDPFTGQTQEISSTPANALRLSDYIYQFGNVNNGQLNIPYHLSANPPIEVTALAQHGYQRARQQVFRTTVTLDKTIAIRHGDLLNIGIAQQNFTASSHSGYYFVASTLHHVRKQAVSSTYSLERGEFRGTVQSLSAQNAQNQLLPEAKAPGEFPNILEVQSSESTKGAGKQSSTKTFAVLVDVNGNPIR